MTKRVLITGGAGYLGNVSVRSLLERGHEVTCLDSLMYDQGNSILPLVTNPNFNFVYGDSRNEDLMKREIKKHDVILPLAALVGAPACKDKPSDAFSINYEAVAMVNRLRSKDQQVICPITNSGYGTKTGETFCTEESSLDPITFYGETKVMAEKALHDSDKGAITLRLATVFGVSPRMRVDLLVNDFVKRAVTDRSIVLFEKDFKRNYIHLQDVADAFIHCMDNYESMVGNVYNLGLDSANMSKLELAKTIKKYVPELEIYESEKGKDPDKRDYIVSNEKIRKAGFEAKVSLDEGIIELKRGFGILLRNIPHTNI
jgi:nucleoside-diphosphate-sugar epimerase